MLRFLSSIVKERREHETVNVPSGLLVLCYHSFMNHCYGRLYVEENSVIFFVCFFFLPLSNLGLKSIIQKKPSLCFEADSPSRIAHKCSNHQLATIRPHSQPRLMRLLCWIKFIASSFPVVTTDIPLLPSISSLSAVDDEEPGGLFTVHWLNNKELHFALAMEVFLQQLRGSLEQQTECSQEGTKTNLGAGGHQLLVWWNSTAHSV